MSDYISREKAIDKLVKIRPENRTGNFYRQGIDAGIAIALLAIKELPSTDVPENIRGEWLDDGLDFINVGMEWRWKKCDQCGYKFSKMRLQAYPNYCQNCGADMRDRDNEK